MTGMHRANDIILQTYSTVLSPAEESLKEWSPTNVTIKMEPLDTEPMISSDEEEDEAESVRVDHHLNDKRFSFDSLGNTTTESDKIVTPEPNYEYLSVLFSYIKKKIFSVFFLIP